MDLTDIHWVIAAGEYGPKSRSINEDWVPSIQQCANQYFPFFFKQWKGFNKKKAGGHLDGHGMRCLRISIFKLNELLRRKQRCIKIRTRSVYALQATRHWTLRFAINTSVAFTGKQKALDFEAYLKSLSSRASAKKRL